MIIGDGTLTFHQSWLETALRCPEEGRLAVAQPQWAGTSDEAFIGTVTHFVIEEWVNGSTASAKDLIDANYDRLLEAEGVSDLRWSKRNSHGEVAAMAAICAKAWKDELAKQFPMDGALTEVKFLVPFGHHLGYELFLEGTIDYLRRSAADWKTSGRAYDQWKKQRWNIQSATYNTAMVLGQLHPEYEYSWPQLFTFAVMIKPSSLQGKAKTQVVSVHRNANHMEWLRFRIHQLVTMYHHYGLDKPWPMIDEDNNLCSAKWCDFWPICRGAFLTEHDLDHKVTVHTNVATRATPVPKEDTTNEQ